MRLGKVSTTARYRNLDNAAPVLVCRYLHSVDLTGQGNNPSLIESVVELQTGLNQLSPLKLLEACETNAQAGADLNAFVIEPQHQRRADAQASDLRLAAGNPVGPLDGVPIAVKANFSRHSLPTSAASNMLHGYMPPYNATLVSRLKDAGAVLMGSTNMDEFGMGSGTIYSKIGPSISPWRSVQFGDNAPRTCGGSSGGSAAAVAAGMALAALGSDTGGSVRLPAAYVGVVGFKPSYGRLSRHGLIAFCSSLDCPGLLTRTAADAALLLSILQGQDLNDSTSLLGDPRLAVLPDLAKHGRQAVVGGLLAQVGLGSSAGRPLAGVRVGVPLEYNVAELSNAVRGAWRRAVLLLQQAGATVVSISLPATKAAVGAYYIIAPAEASSNLARYDGIRYGFRDMQEEADAAEAGLSSLESGELKRAYQRTRTQGFGPEVQRRILMGTFALSSQRVAEYYQKAQQVRRLVADDFKAAFREVDVLLTPVAPGIAPTIAEMRAMRPAQMYAIDAMTVPASLAGLPAISVPMGVSEREGLPVGLQLIGPPLQEAPLLAVASILEDAQAREA